MRLPRRPHMPGYQKSAPGSGPAGPALAPNREPSAAGHDWKEGARKRARNGRQAVSSKRTLCRRGCFPSQECSQPAGRTSPYHRFRTFPMGRSGTGPYGGSGNRRDGRMISAPTNHRGPAPGGRTRCDPMKAGKSSQRRKRPPTAVPDIPGGPAWDRPPRWGIKPGRRADDIRPYGITVARHPAGAHGAPLRKPGNRASGGNVPQPPFRTFPAGRPGTGPRDGDKTGAAGG